jgi:hypothetical protein
MALINYFGHTFSLLRVCYLQDPNDGFNGPEYWTTKVLVFDSRSESFSAEHFVGFAEKKTLYILATSLDTGPQSAEYQLAVVRFVIRMLGQKVRKTLGGT